MTSRMASGKSASDGFVLANAAASWARAILSAEVDLVLGIRKSEPPIQPSIRMISSDLGQQPHEKPVTTELRPPMQDPMIVDEIPVPGGKMDGLRRRADQLTKFGRRVPPTISAVRPSHTVIAVANPDEASMLLHNSDIAPAIRSGQSQPRQARRRMIPTVHPQHACTVNQNCLSASRRTGQHQRSDEAGRLILEASICVRRQDVAGKSRHIFPKVGCVTRRNDCHPCAGLMWMINGLGPGVEQRPDVSNARVLDQHDAITGENVRNPIGGDLGRTILLQQ
nr:hypothetical protein [Micromonospora endophytica]